MTLQTGAQGAGEAIKEILIALINGENADPNIRDQVGGNLTAIRDALADLSSSVFLPVLRVAKRKLKVDRAVVDLQEGQQHLSPVGHGQHRVHQLCERGERRREQLQVTEIDRWTGSGGQRFRGAWRTAGLA